MARAVETARVMQAKMHILRVLSPAKRRTSAASTRLLMSSLRVVEEVLATSSPGASWGIPAAEIVSSVAVLHGDFEQSAAAYAEAVGSTCIVLVDTGGVLLSHVIAPEHDAGGSVAPGLLPR